MSQQQAAGSHCLLTLLPFLSNCCRYAKFGAHASPNLLITNKDIKKETHVLVSSCGSDTELCCLTVSLNDALGLGQVAYRLSHSVAAWQQARCHLLLHTSNPVL